MASRLAKPSIGQVDIQCSPIVSSQERFNQNDSCVLLEMVNCRLGGIFSATPQIFHTPILLYLAHPSFSPEAAMSRIPSLESQLDPHTLSIWQSIKTPFDIQTYLDSLTYMHEDLDRCPLRVMQDGQCHCLDGGLLAAAGLRRIGFLPQLLDLVPAAGLDDDHVLAVYQINGKYGAVAKSNFAGLRFREPVYRSLRELAMSYFEVFFNVEGIKTLRGYTRPLKLTAFDQFQWETTQEGTLRVVQKFYSLRSIALISEEEAAALHPLDQRSYDANTHGTDFNELYQA